MIIASCRTRLGNSCARCIESLNRSEEGGLVANYVAVADEDDLRVGRVEVASRSGEDIVGSKLANPLSIRFEVVFR